MATVSYTHLDVYKRQGQNSSIADIVSNLNAQFAASSTYQAAGLTAAATASLSLIHI